MLPRILIAALLAFGLSIGTPQAQMLQSIVNANPPAAAGGCSTATTVLAGMSLTGTSTTGNKGYYTTFICGLVTDGTWSLFDVIYIFGTQDATNALINVANPGTNNAGTTGSPAFTAYKGYASLNSGSLTSINSSAGTNFVQNSASTGIWEGSTSSAPTYGITGSDSDNVSTAANYFASTSCDIFDSSAINGSSNGVGLTACNRSGILSAQVYLNGVGIGTNTTFTSAASSGVNAVTSGNAGPIIAAWFFGGSLTSTQHGTVYNRFNTLLTALGSN